MTTNYWLHGDIVDHGHLERLDAFELQVQGWTATFVLGWMTDEDRIVGVLTPAEHAAGRGHIAPSIVPVKVGDQVHVGQDAAFIILAPHPGALRQVPRVELVRSVNFVSHAPLSADKVAAVLQLPKATP